MFRHRKQYVIITNRGQIITNVKDVSQCGNWKWGGGGHYKFQYMESGNINLWKADFGSNGCGNRKSGVLICITNIT